MSASDRSPSSDLLGVRVVLEGAIAGDVGRLCEYEPLVREGSDPEAVHQARVACRRLRSQLRTFAPALRTDGLGEVVGELRWLGGLLGRVRDLDVLGERLAEDGREVGESLSRPVLQRCAMDRQEAFADLVIAMGRKRYRRLLAGLEALASDPPVRRTYADQPAARVLLPEVRRRWLELDGAISSLPAAARDKELHRIRIVSKRARYSAEVAAEFGPGELGRLAKRLAKVQKVLGELNDAARAVVWLECLKVYRWPRSTHANGGSDPLVAVELALSAEHRALAAHRRDWLRPVEAARDSATALGWPVSGREAEGGAGEGGAVAPGSPTAPEHAPVGEATGRDDGEEGRLRSVPVRP
jgi:CHAD domain-containing protein